MSIEEQQGLPVILPVKSDLIFRIFFADERNQDDLVSLLKAVLRLPEDDYDEIEIADPHLLPEYVDDKYAIIDVKLHTKSKKIVHIEIQLKITPELSKRVVYYTSKLVTEQIGSGGNYDEIQNVISIIILDKTLIQNSPKYHHRFILYDREAGVEFTDIVEVNTIELDKLPEATDGTQLYDWAKFINAKTEEELTVIAERNPQIGKAVVKLRQLSADERTRDLYERREKARRDIESQNRWGIKQREFEIAKNALGMGLSLNEIAKLTGLTPNEVESLRNS